MKRWLYIAVEWMARIHDRILRYSKTLPFRLSDKQLHFIVIGLLGMALYFVIQPLFRALIRRGYERAVSWIYVFTLILVITFGIEIGQRLTRTGSMELADIVYGLSGFLTMFAVYALLRALVLGIAKLLRKRR